MRSYIVRIYRETQGNPRGVVGVVEESGADGKRAFSNIDELWEILKPKKQRGVKSGKSGKLLTRSG